MNKIKETIRKGIITILLKIVAKFLNTRETNEVMLLFSISKYLEIELQPHPEGKMKEQEQVKLVSQAFRIDPEQMFLRTKKREIVEARQFFFWYKIVKEGWGPNIALKFGFDHATAIHAKKTVFNLMEISKAFKIKFQRAIKELETLKKIPA